MSKIKLITDSAADIPAELAREYNIQVLPFSIAMGDKEYRDNVDFTPQEFYRVLLEADQIPTHSQIPPITFVDNYEAAWQEGYTDFIYVSINAKGSNTFENAGMAREEFYAAHPQARDAFRIHLIDSKEYTYAYGYAVVEGAKLAASGGTAEEVVALIQDWLDHVKILFVVYDLKFAKLSGRISAAAAILGGALGIRPIMTFLNGDSKIEAKVRGDKAAIPSMLKMARSEMEPGSPYLVINAGLPERNQEVTAACEQAFGYPAAQVFLIGGVIAINAGPSLVGVIYRKKA